jgi:tripartite-type tricarboxylate transporter receptor subunit TctC
MFGLEIGDVLVRYERIVKLLAHEYGRALTARHDAHIYACLLSELIALAKQNPGKLAYASAGIGSPFHIAAELFKQTAGVDILHVPYKGGAPAVSDVVSGQIDIESIRPKMLATRSE